MTAARTFLIALLIAAGPLVAAASTPASHALHDAFDAQQCYRYVAQIVGFGERQPGQPGHVKTEPLIKRVVARNGGRIESDDFTARTPRGCRPRA